MKIPRIITTAFIALTIGTLLGLNSAFGNTVEKQAKETIIPKLEFKEVTVSAALKMFTTATGIKAFYTRPENDEWRLTISLKNVPASQAIGYITGLANLKFTYEEDGVHVTAK